MSVSKKVKEAHKLLAELVIDEAEEDWIVPKEAKPPDDVPDYVVSDGSIHQPSILNISDIHFPIQDQKALGAVLAFARDVKPEVAVVNGDVYDCFMVSSHDKEPSRLFSPGARLQEEFDAAIPMWKELLKTCKRVHFNQGNHEYRLARLISANPGLFGLRALEWQRVAGIPESVTVHAYGARLRVGLVNFIHGNRLGSRFGLPKHILSWILENHGNRSVALGHTHKLGMCFKTTWDEAGYAKQYVAINSGHLSNVKLQTYVYEPNWQTGAVFFEGWSFAGEPRFTPHLLPIVDGQVSYGGKVYKDGQ